MRESKIEKSIINFAIARGWFQCKFTSPSLNAMPDRFFLRRGKIIFIEIKAPGEVPTEQQAKRHRDLRDHGAEVYWFDNLEDAMEVLK